jgi:hypothetical protein
MTFRAVILGFLGALLIAGFGYINDRLLRLNYVVNNHFPITVFGLLALVAMLVNPVLYKLRRNWRLRASELAMIVALMLVTCSIPGSGLLRTFTQLLVMPIQYNETFPGWKKWGALDYVPPAMMPAGAKYDERIVGNFQSGMGHAENIALSDVPWDGWREPLLTWMPIILLMSAGMVCLSLIIHRQWALRERLRYPIADFAASVMDQDPNRVTAPLFRNRLFWAGLILVLVIRMVNGIALWYPQFLEIPLKFNFAQIEQKYEILGKIPRADHLTEPEIFPTVLAFCFFLPTDVGLGLASSFPAYIVVGWLLFTWPDRVAILRKFSSRSAAHHIHGQEALWAGVQAGPYVQTALGGRTVRGVGVQIVDPGDGGCGSNPFVARAPLAAGDTDRNTFYDGVPGHGQVGCRDGSFLHAFGLAADGDHTGVFRGPCVRSQGSVDSRFALCCDNIRPAREPHAVPGQRIEDMR